MKKSRKLFAFMLAVLSVMMTVAGCGKESGKGGNKGGNATTDIELSYWNAGLGVEWLDAIVDAFEKKYPEYNVYYKATALKESATVTYGMEGDTVDLYLSTTPSDMSYLEPLDDVLDTVVEGEGKPISEKFSPAYLDTAGSSDGKYYQLTYGGGVVGVAYNTEHFEEAGIKQEPRTTNELIVACDTLKSSGHTPFIHFTTTGYWDWMIDAFFCQYDGFDYLKNNFYACKDENGDSPSKEVFLKKDGRYEAMAAMEKMITPDYVFQGSNTMDHTTAQTHFLNGSASMMVTGSWLTSEMESVGGIEKFRMMRTPVLSAIVDKLTTVKTEGDLRKVVSAIDGIADGEKTLADYQDNGNYLVDGLSVSADDWDYIYNARFAVPNNYSGSNAYIPNYSNCKEGAKKFLTYLYSDEGYQVYADALEVPLPISLSDGTTIDMTGWNDFQKSQVTILQEATSLPNAYMASRHRIFIDGGVGGGLATVVGENFVSAFCSSNAADRLTAEQLWAKIEQKVNDNFENVWLKNIK